MGHMKFNARSCLISIVGNFILKCRRSDCEVNQKWTFLYSYTELIRFPTQTPRSSFPYIHATCYTHLIILDSITDIWWGLRNMKPVTMQLSPTSCHFLPLRSKYSPQHNVMKHTHIFLRIRNQVSNPYITTGIIITFYILFYKFIGIRWVDKLFWTEG
jgi:hypothetical protein